MTWAKRSINDLIDNGLVESDSQQRLCEADWALHALREARAVLMELQWIPLESAANDNVIRPRGKAMELLKKWDEHG